MSNTILIQIWEFHVFSAFLTVNLQYCGSSFFLIILIIFVKWQTYLHILQWIKWLNIPVNNTTVEYLWIIYIQVVCITFKGLLFISVARTLLQTSVHVCYSYATILFWYSTYYIAKEIFSLSFLNVSTHTHTLHPAGERSLGLHSHGTSHRPFRQSFIPKLTHWKASEYPNDQSYPFVWTHWDSH